MHLYWMVIEELKYMGETWLINDPCLARRYRQWLQKNAEAIHMSVMERTENKDGRFEYKGFPHSLN